REGAHPHDAMQGPGWLVAVAAAEFREAQRQLAVAVQPVAEDQHMPRTAHRFQRQHLVVAALGDEHVLAEFLPVPGGFPQSAIEQLRAFDLEIPCLVEPHAQVILDDAEQRPALRMPEDAAYRLLADVEKVELAAEPAMVAALRL